MSNRLRVVASNLDDLLRNAYEELRTHGEEVPTNRGDTLELRGVSLELTNPLARLSRSRRRGRALSAIGEFAWYASGSASLTQIEHYIPKYGEFIASTTTSSGAYGPRLFGSQGKLEATISRLAARATTRQAVIQIFANEDLSGNPSDVPCTCSLQFLVRADSLELQVHMRSNDAFIGLPHDVFSFTMLQEYVARRLGVAVGAYLHTVGSFHLYARHLPAVDAYLEEGFFESHPMRTMPESHTKSDLENFVSSEALIRAGSIGLEAIQVGYWGDLELLLFAQRLANGEFGDKTGPEGRRVRDRLEDQSLGIYVSDLQFRTARGELGER